MSQPWIDFATSLAAPTDISVPVCGAQVSFHWQQQRSSRVLVQWLGHRGWSLADLQVTVLPQIQDWPCWQLHLVPQKIYRASLALVAQREHMVVFLPPAVKCTFSIWQQLHEAYPAAYFFIIGTDLTNQVKNLFSTPSYYTQVEFHSYQDTGFDLFVHKDVPHYRLFYPKTLMKELPAAVRVQLPYLAQMLQFDPVAKALHAPIGAVIQSTNRLSETCVTPAINYRQVVAGHPVRIKAQILQA